MNNMNTPTNIAAVCPEVPDSQGNLMRVGDKVAYAARGYCGRINLRIGTIAGILQDKHGFALKLEVVKKTGYGEYLRKQTMRNFSRMAKIS